MRVLLCRSRYLDSWLIRWLTWSPWSHSGILMGDLVIEAGWPTVRVSTLAEVLATHSDYAVVSLPCPDPEIAIGAALSQVGKPYDWRALFGFLFRRDWQERDSWFCSELVAWAAKEGGARWFRADSLNRVTPGHLWMLGPDE